MAGKAGIRANRSKYSGQEVKKGLPEQLTCKRCRLDLSENKTRAAANGQKQANNLTRSNFGVEMRFPGLGRARLVSVLNLIKNDDNACGKKLLRFKWKRKIILLHKTV